MRLALISDVHANVPAIASVLEAIRREAPDVVVCLGDLVGYNAEPSEVIGLIRDLGGPVVVGNHDRDASQPGATPGTNASARIAQSWTQERLSQDERDYLNQLPNIVVEPSEFVAVHGCYLNRSHVSGYVTSTMLGANLRAVRDEPDWPKVSFCGHTHTAMCGWLHRDEVIEPAPPAQVEWPAAVDAVLINPGAVGQPRDGDPRAAFALVDLRDRWIEFRRVEYDVAAAARTIREAGLPEDLAERLRVGR